jgi:type VI secretion system protein ImpG
MLDDLLPYYERELTYLRELSGEFARRYPKIARRLSLEGDQSEDPHVERLMEGFAFLAARIHRKIDDEFPEISEAFMQVLYPHYTQPFPSCTILQFETDPQRPEITARHTVPRHHPALSAPVQGVQCRFRTAYDVDLYPLTLKQVRLQLAQASEHLRRLAPQAAAAITLEFETQGGLALRQIGLERLRFFLDGEPALTHLLYELLLTRTHSLRCSDGTERPERSTRLPASALAAVGFAPEEALLDHDDRSFAGYRLLSEYFAFPDKFLFVDLQGLSTPTTHFDGSLLRIDIFLDSYPDNERFERLAQTLSTSHFRLGCTPAINLFHHAAEPIRLSHEKTTYPVLVDGRRPRAYEVIAIESVANVDKFDGKDRVREVPPFYSVRHHARTREQAAFWYATRERSVWEDDAGTDLSLSFVDLDFTPRRPELEVLSLELLCSNRDLPAQLPFGGSSSGVHTDFTLPQVGVVKRARVLRKPTASIRPPAKRGLQWRLISHLSLNHLSMVAQGKQALQEMLTLYNYSESPAALRQIQGIVGIASTPATTRAMGKHFSGFVRGLDVTLTLDEAAFVGAGMIVFGNVLERFFALYCGPNSFTRLRLCSKQQEEEIARWPARAGEALVI